MIEVVFNNSVRVALRIAKNYNKDDVLNGAIEDDYALQFYIGCFIIL